MVVMKKTVFKNIYIKIKVITMMFVTFAIF